MSNVLRRRPALAVALALFCTACTSSAPAQDANLEGLREIVQRVDQERLKTTVAELVESHLTDTPLDCTNLNGDYYPPLCHLTRDKARDLMQARLEELGLEVKHHELLSRGLLTTNLYADIPGTTHPEEIVLIGAHFDAYWAGADDNSTGVAAVLELARIFSGYRFDRTVRFMGFDLEELGLIGSNRYVNDLSGERIISALILDTIGYYTSAPGSQQSMPGLPSPDTGDFLTVISNDVSSSRAAELYALNDSLGLMKVVPLIAPRDGASPVAGELLRSDHMPFWFTGRQALFLTDTANFRNPNYHTETDTLETLDFALYTKAVQVSAATLSYWAGGPR